ncbi:MAG: hypothetical protein Kow009_03960 [Spirochaetales bacterium]
MASPAGKVCIVYTNHSLILRTARVAENVLVRWGWQVTMKPAENTRIPDLAPVDFILFGAEESLSLPDSSYKELYRSMQGVNFAGRKGALFSTSPSGIEALRRMLEDSELSVARSPFLVQEDPTEQAVESWLRVVTGNP